MKNALLIATTFMALAPHAFASSCVPEAQWSGKLILPQSSQRSADGGVNLLVENAPAQYASLKGQVVHLAYGRGGSAERTLFDQRKRDVSFGPKAKAAMDKDGLVLPRGLDGWSHVSPLESLAASRPNDVIRAEIKNVDVVTNTNGTTLVTAQEPQLIDGDEQCLVQFVSVDGETAIVRHYNKDTASFTGETEEIAMDFKPNLPKGNEYQKLTLQGITTQKNNLSGWNIYGSRSSGKFVMEGLEPYAMYRVEARDGDDVEVKTFEKESLKDYWDISSADKTRARKLIYQPSNGKTTADFKLGDRFLVSHAFGAFNNNGMTLGKYRGHASLGLAEIIRHPISGEPIFQIIYKQTYGHSGGGTFAASYRSSSYTGNLYRGLSFLRPTTDILYPLTDLGVNFINQLTVTLDNLNSDYRVGFGHGWARVTSITSCVHDTGNALIELLNKYLPKNESPLLSLMQKNLGKEVIPAAKFRNAELLDVSDDFKISTLFQVRKNLTIAIPRDFQDALFKSFATDNRYPVVILQTIMPGDDLPQATPHAPDRINTLLGTVISSILPKKEK